VYQTLLPFHKLTMSLKNKNKKEEKLLQWLVSQQTEELDMEVKCKMILET